MIIDWSDPINVVQWAVYAGLLAAVVVFAWRYDRGGKS